MPFPSGGRLHGRQGELRSGKSPQQALGRGLGGRAVGWPRVQSVEGLLGVGQPLSHLAFDQQASAGTGRPC